MEKTVIYRDYTETPLGKMIILATEKQLCGFDFVTKARLALLERKLQHCFSSFEYECKKADPIRKTENWCSQFFRGSFKEFDLSLLNLGMGTQFEVTVWQELVKIPVGAITTYGTIGKSIACRSARAVGGAVGSNPWSIIVPCHRVVGASSTLTGYGGGLHRKTWLLRHEGVEVFDQRVKNKTGADNLTLHGAI